jgi:hypothetical protein
MEVMQSLYDSEINFTIETFWDGGFDVKLGDRMNGFVWEENFDTLQQAVDALVSAACDHYPESVFAKSRNGPMIAKADQQTPGG